MKEVFDRLDKTWGVYNKDTGEFGDTSDVMRDYFEQIGNEKAEKGFQLTYLNELEQYLSVVKNQKIELLMYLLKNKSNTNILNLTQQQIINETGIAKRVVNDVMQELQKEGLLKKIRNGVYILLPKICIRGGAGSFMAAREWEKLNEKL